MKHMKKITALILCAAMLIPLTGCFGSADSTEPSTQPTETVPTEPSADVLYAEARKALDEAVDISLELAVTTYMTVNDDEFSEQSQQTLTYNGLGTENLLVSLEETISYGIHDEKDENGEVAAYREIFGDGTLYAVLDDMYYFSGQRDQEFAQNRYIPAVLLDEALYADISAEETSEGTKILFAGATVPESWAIPEEAEMTEASGSALIGTDGAITQMDYKVSFTYGPVDYVLEVQSKPLAETETVSLPEKTSLYTAIEYPEVLRISLQSASMQLQSDSVITGSFEQLICQAAGVVRNHTVQMHLDGRMENMLTKIENSVYLFEFASNREESYEQEETYIDGKYTYSADGGLPETMALEWDVIWEYCMDESTSFMPSYNYWQDVEVTDLGSLYLMEFVMTENFGNTMQNSICKQLWNEPSFLLDLSSNYVNDEVTAYLSVDKYSGLPVAGGYYYKGIHTIEGVDYELTLQYDQSVEAPAFGAYKEITDEMPFEPEPEQKATPLFYHVTGEEGEEMWLFGTIHIGDERTAYLPAEIRNAFEASDALAIECDTEAFDEQMEEDDDLQSQVSDLYFFSDGTTLESLMGEEDYAIALKFAKGTGNYNANMPMAKPYVWSSSIENFYQRQGQSLHSDQGVEERLTAWAEELEKPILEVESSMFQIQMLTGYSNELQLRMLEDAMAMSALEYQQGVQELYELWCAGDEDAMFAELNEEADFSEMTEEERAEYEALMEEYNTAMSYDRNEGMLDKAVEYLKSGDVIFYAVGLAHLLDGENGLVQALRDAGYTVELVTYQ